MRLQSIPLSPFPDKEGGKTGSRGERLGRVLVALSGGVDSAVAALLLKQQGYEIVGAFMKLGSAEGENKCCSMESLCAARDVAAKLKFKLYVLNFADYFAEQIIGPFARAYARGLTPNPCVRCNRLIKFSLLFKKAEELNCDFLATGHYAQITRDEAGYHLRCSADKQKDQTYFLYNLKQSQLAKIKFPVGGMVKAEVYKMARAAGLSSAERPESQEICFVPGKTASGYLKKALAGKIRPGPIMFHGKKIGEHEGLPLYTIGQRKGIKIGGVGPFYVLSRDFARNVLQVTNRFDDPELFAREMRVRDPHWSSGTAPQFPAKLSVKIRYGHAAAGGTLEAGSRIVFDEPQRAVTPGQAAVFYNGDEVVGGGEIC